MSLLGGIEVVTSKNEISVCFYNVSIGVINST